MSDRQRQYDRLDEGSINLIQVLFQSITHMSPAVAVIFALGIGFSFAGAALPLSLILTLGVALLIGNSVGQLAKHIPSAGGTYTYAARAFGPRAGFLIGATLLFTEILIPLAGGLVLGSVLEGPLADAGVPIPWWVFAIAAVLLFHYLNYRSVGLSTGAGIVLGLFEISIVLGLALYMIFLAGDANTLQVLNPNNALEGSWSGVFKGMVFSILAFQGFEAAAPLGEEARDARRTIPRAVIGSALLVGIIYFVCAYGVVMGWGFDNIATYPEDPNPWGTLATRFWGAGSILILLALVNGALAGGNAGMVYSTRLMYALGRARVLPSVVGRTHPTHRTPSVAVTVQTVISLAGGLAAGFIWGPGDATSVIFTLIATLIVLGYMGTCLACTTFYLRERRNEFNFVLHGVLPVAGALVLLAPLYYTFNPLPDYPVLWGVWCALAWLVFTVAAMIYLSSRRPDALQAASEVFVDEGELEAPESREVGSTDSIAGSDSSNPKEPRA